MSAWKNVALATLVWSGLSAQARAVPLSWMTSPSSQGWSVWSKGAKVEVAAPTPVAAPVFSPVISPPPSAAPPSNPAPQTGVVFARTTSAGLVSASAYQGKPDAFLNFGDGAYADAGLLVQGTIQPWYESGSVRQAFGGSTPDAGQQQAFEGQVLQYVQDTFARSGLSPNITLDPNAAADHTMSVVSGASFVNNPNAIGITNVGYNGFSFIDKLSYADSPEELARAVASNMAHELMHAFGVGAHHDNSGAYLDSASASWDMLTDPNVSFSKDAVNDLLADKPSFNPEAAKSLSAQVLTGPDGLHTCAACQFALQTIAPSPVPEPTTVAVWGVGLALGVGVGARSRRRVAS